jgi:hypothetical protein
MKNQEAIKLFEYKTICTLCNAEMEKGFISIVDVIEVLTNTN